MPLAKWVNFVVDKRLCIAGALLLSLAGVASAQTRPTTAPHQTPHLKRDRTQRLLYPKIVEHEDERAVDDDLIDMLALPHAGVKRRAILALGRIGYPSGVAPLVDVLNTSHDADLRALAAFSLGLIASNYAVEPLLDRLQSTTETPEVRACVAEALGKIVADKFSAEALGEYGKKAVTSTLSQLLPDPAQPLTGDGKLIAYVAMTALTRIKAPSTVPAISSELKSQDLELRWRAANALARMGSSIEASVPLLLPLLNDTDPLVRAHATRALGVARNGSAVDSLIKALSDSDARVCADAIVALGRIGDPRATDALLAFGRKQLADYKSANRSDGVPVQQNFLLLIATAFGNIKDTKALDFLQECRSMDGKLGWAPETEMAVGKLGESAFFGVPENVALPKDNWRAMAAYAQGLGEIPTDHARKILTSLLSGDVYGKPDARAIPDILKALASTKAEDLRVTMLAQLKADDVIVRATAAELLGNLGDSSDPTINALEEGLKAAQKDKVNDARIAIIEAADKLGHPFNTLMLAGSLRDQDYVVRRRAAELLRESKEEVNLSKLQIGKAATGHDRAYWKKIALLMVSKNPIAILHTRKGDIKIELFAADAPMTVDNFIQLSRGGFYNGLSFMRVVPDFVIQGGDPRGDTNGGPGYQIRDEINMRPYLTGTVGMALSGKDTGGSQFFITHSPQPHLDGGYTVFGQVVSGMDVVNRIARGDLIDRVDIVDQETASQ
jgi:cyclophilin family peptidyl-prolyl cis-trans isomerase/HEAT repeat protein